jgi:hypothetical protein
MNFGEIRVFRFKRAQGRAEAISADLGIDAAAQLVIVDEKMVIIFDVVVVIVHVPYRKAFLFEAIEVLRDPYHASPQCGCSQIPSGRPGQSQGFNVPTAPPQ